MTKKIITPLIILSIVILAFLVYWFGLRRTATLSNSTTSKTTVTTSFYPLYFFTTQIAQDKATVYNITPPGTEPHDYEPTTRDSIQLEKSRLVIINGAGLEPWADR